MNESATRTDSLKDAGLTGLTRWSLCAQLKLNDDTDDASDLEASQLTGRLLQRNVNEDIKN